MIHLTALQLYPSQMNLYGDWGNVVTLQHLAKHADINLSVVAHEVGSDTDWSQVDIVIGGGGQDSGQLRVHEDLLTHRAALSDLGASGVPMLLICGMYQLFGTSFTTGSGTDIPGLSILGAHTTTAGDRIIGNLQVETTQFGRLIGYENHSGRTHLHADTAPLGTCPSGCGNTGEDGQEGARWKEIIGTYLHGPLLPKNPQLATYLLRTAIKRREPNFDGELQLPPMLAQLTQQAREQAAGRPR